MAAAYKEELSHIVANDREDPAMDTTYFPNTLSGFYWTSTPFSPSNSGAVLVNFDTGSIVVRKIEPNYVRLVRGGD